MKSPFCSVLVALWASSTANGFGVSVHPRFTSIPRTETTRLFEQDAGAEPSDAGTGRPDFEFSFEVPKKGISDVGTAEVSLPPLLESSEVVVVRYNLPFGLNAEPQDGQVVVTKDGKPDGGEKVGDILRQTTYWRGKTPGLFDVSKNAGNFDLVVQALVTNDLAVADEIVLIFERPC